jgi:hypothetical protein
MWVAFVLVKLVCERVVLGCEIRKYFVWDFYHFTYPKSYFPVTHINAVVPP